MDVNVEINPNSQKTYSKKTRVYLLIVQLIFLYLPLLQFFNIKTDNGNIPASACYFFSLIFIPYLLINLKDLQMPPWYITFLCAYVLILAIIRMPEYGLSKSILHWGFGFYLLVILLNAGKDFRREDWLHILEIGACTFAVLHFLYMLLNYEAICFFLKGYFDGTVTGMNTGAIPALTRGGKNLDCTWLGLGAFFIRGKKKAVYVTYCILFSFFCCSRVGVISIGLVVLWSLLYDSIYRLSLKNLKLYIAGGFAILFVLFGTGIAQTFLGRNLISLPAPTAWLSHTDAQTNETVAAPVNTLTETALPNVSIMDSELSNAISVEKFLNGRAAMWRMFPQVFRDNPLGYGVGNAMRVLRSQYGYTGGEDVIHNVFFQWSLDEGFIGGIWFLGLLAAFLHGQRKKWPRCFEDPFAGYFLTYFVLSLVQFHGAEALMVFVLGAYLNDKKQHIICKNIFHGLKLKNGTI